VDPAQTSVTYTVEKEQILELPVSSRNYLNFVLLAPGLTTATRQAASHAGGAPSDSGFSFGGLRPRSNNVSIDGLDNNDEYAGSSRTALSLETVQEFQVVLNGMSAESGGASGGSINVVTRTGSNLLHGDVFLFLQNGQLNSRNPFERESGRPGLSRYCTGFSIGGPVVKDQTFYYTAFEQEHYRNQEGSLLDPATASAINNFLSSGRYSRLPTRHVTTGSFPVARSETELSGKLNHQISSRNSLMLRYAFTNNRVAGNAFNTSGLDDASARGSSFTGDHSLAGSLATVFGSQAVGDLRFQAATRRVVLRTNESAGSGVDIVGLAHFGRPHGGNSRRRENHYQLGYTYTQTKGRHLLKTGAAVNRVRLRATILDGIGGIYIFGSLGDFFKGCADFFRQAFGNAGSDYTVSSYGAFIQDHWSVTPKVTLDLGLRYDLERLPIRFEESKLNFGPRVGLAYSPATRWVLRAGYGIFFDRYVLSDLNRAVVKDGVQGFEQVATGEVAAQIFQTSAGGPLPVPAQRILPSIFRADPRMATPYSQQVSLGAEFSLTPDLRAGTTALFVRGIKLSRTRNINLLPPAVLTAGNAASLGLPNPTMQQIGREVFPAGRLVSQFNDIMELESSASSTYRGLSLSLNQRMADELQFTASYTLSNTLDDASDFDEQPQNPFRMGEEHAISRQHQRQRFVFSALWELPFGEEGQSRLIDRIFGHVEMAPIITLGSGRPTNPLTGLDSARTNTFPLSARPQTLGRNSLRTPWQTTFDLRAVKFFPFGKSARLDLVAEFFNLFNHSNVAGINPFFGSNATPLPSFARPIEGFGARQIQFSLDYEF
jgi:hypothetical protein